MKDDRMATIFPLDVNMEEMAKLGDDPEFQKLEERLRVN